MARPKLRVDTLVDETTSEAVSDEIADTQSATATAVSDDTTAAECDERQEAVSVIPEPHYLERAIQQELLNQPDVQFSSLVVRRFRDGLCLQGVIEVGNEVPDIERLARELSGVDRVMNHLVVRRHAADV